VQTIIEYMWDHYSVMIRNWILIPFCFYFVSGVLYFYSVAAFNNSSNVPQKYETAQFIVGCIFFALNIFFFGYEVIQMKKKGLYTYMTDFYNYIDLAAAVLSFIVILNNSTNLIELNDVAKWIAVSIAFILFKVFYWLRFFDATCHYVRLILDSMFSVRYFFLLFFIILLAFGAPLYFLSRSRASISEEQAEAEGLEPEEYGPLVSDHIGIVLLDIAFNMYLLALGEFESMDNYDGVDSGFIWLIFFLATFVVQITFLNVLIAIMGDVYGEVMEKKDQARLKEKISILDDYITVIEKDTTLNSLNLIITEIAEDTDISELDLAVEKLDKSILEATKKSDHHIAQLETRTENIQNIVIELQKVMLQNQANMTDIKKQISELSERI